MLEVKNDRLLKGATEARADGGAIQVTGRRSSEYAQLISVIAMAIARCTLRKL